MPDVVSRILISDLLWRHALEEGADLVLPYSITVEAEERSVTVDAEVRPIHGMCVKGDPRWVGTMQLGDVTIKVTTTSSAELSLRVCVDASSLPEFSPPGIR